MHHYFWENLLAWISHWSSFHPQLKASAIEKRLAMLVDFPAETGFVICLEKKLQWYVHKHRDLPSVFLCRQSLCPLNPEEVTSVNWAGFILTTDQFDELRNARAKHWIYRPFSWPSNTVINKPCVKRPSIQTKHSQHWWCSLYILFRRWNSDILDVSYKQV